MKNTIRKMFDERGDALEKEIQKMRETTLTEQFHEHNARASKLENERSALIRLKDQFLCYEPSILLN